jgi:hypothetical protein
MTAYTPRYVRTRNHRKRRLTLAHVEAQALARLTADGEILTTRDLLDAWHISGPFGEKPVAVGRRRPCLYRKSRERQAAKDARMREEIAASNLAYLRQYKTEYFRLTPFANGSEYDYWTERNCCRCARYNPGATDPADTCPLEWALSLGGDEGDGRIGNAIAGRIWRTGQPGGPCSEREEA